MKLAEALLERKSIKDQINDLQERLNNNVQVQEGDAPAEEPEKLISKINELINQLEILVMAINKTNLKATLQDGTTIMEAIARRDMLKLHHNILELAAKTATVNVHRFSRSEIKFQTTINLKQLQQQIDMQVKNYRELDTAIQAANWLTECEGL